MHGRQSIGQYTIAQIERMKHLKPKFSEYKIISKLSYHFSRDIQLAVYAQGIKTVEEILILVTQAENIKQGSNTKHYVQPHVNYNIVNYDEYTLDIYLSLIHISILFYVYKFYF